MLEADRWVPGAVQLVIDGTPQSHVNLRHPDELFFEYIRRIGHVIDLFRTPGAPISALHLGGGAYSLPRYIEATRPGSRQQIIELEGSLVDLVRTAAPLPKSAPIRVRRGDARELLGKLPGGMRNALDLVVIDIFDGDHTPARVASREFYELVLPYLGPDAVLCVNVADGRERRFVRGQIATLQSLFPAVIAIAEPGILKGRRFGNIVLVASQQARDANRNDLSWLPRLLAAGPHPARLLQGKELDEFVAGAAPVVDETATDSPSPEQGVFGNG